MKKIRKCKCNQGVAPSSKTIYWEIISWEHEVATSAWNYLLTEKPKAEKNSIIGGNQHCPLCYNPCSSHRRWVKKDTHTFYLGNFKVNQKNNEKIKWTLSILKDTSRGTGVKWAKAKKTNLVLSKSNGHGTSHQPGPPYYNLLKNSVKMILLKN